MKYLELRVLVTFVSKWNQFSVTDLHILNRWERLRRCYIIRIYNAYRTHQRESSLILLFFRIGGGHDFFH